MANILRGILALSLLTSMSLVGCTKKEVPTEDTDTGIVEPSESEVSEEESTSEESVSESEESSESEQESTESEIVYTIDMVAEDIGTALGVTLNNKETYYVGSFNFSQEGVDYSNSQAEESVLKPVVTTLKQFMPEYLTLVGEKYFTSEEDFWADESGDTAYYALLSVDEVAVALISYCYNSMLIGQVQVSATSAE